MKYSIVLILIFSCFPLKAQIQIDDHIYANAYTGAGRQSMVFFKLEPIIYYKDWGQALINIGYGFAPGSIEDDLYFLNSFSLEAGHTFGYKFIFLNIGIEPTLNFYNKVTYIDINGVLGVRYQNKSPERKFRYFEIGYNPHLFRTHNNVVDLPYWVAIGVTI